MSKQKFTLSNDFVKITPEVQVVKKEVLLKKAAPTRERGTPNKTELLYTGPKTNRVHFSTSLDAALKNEFKVWVVQQGSDMSTELEKAIRIIMKKNKCVPRGSLRNPLYKKAFTDQKTPFSTR